LIVRLRTTNLGEVDRVVSIGINLDSSAAAHPKEVLACLVDHVLKLSLGRVLAKGAHDSAELLGGDGSISICIGKRGAWMITRMTKEQDA
jgi:hypothetical protein